MLKRLAGVVAIAALATGCSPDAELASTKLKLDEANKKIVALEAKLANAPDVTEGEGPQLTEKKLRPSVTTTPKVEPTGQQWQYEATEDPMSGGKRFTASVRSSNSVSFDFPYAGAQHGTITIRSGPGKGKDVLFFIERGQILCPSYEGCSAQVRFDDEKPVRFRAVGPADHSSETIFLHDYSKFLAKLKKAKRVRLSVEIFQNGSPAFEFDVSGFDPVKYQPNGN